MTRLEALGPEAAEEASGFCADHPNQATYIGGWVHDGGLLHRPEVSRGWLLAERDASDQIVGLCHLSSSGILIPATRSDSAVEHLFALIRANPGLVRVIVGERQVVAALWDRIQPLGFTARLMRDQRVYTIARGALRGPEGLLPLSIAETRDLDELVRASGAMAREEANDDPQARNPGLFRDRIRARIARRRDLIYRQGGQLAFKSNISALSPIGGQIEGVYTTPEYRRQGLGLRGTAAVTDWVLERSPRAVLLVNEDNAPARRMYERLGYQPSHGSRTVFVAP